MTYITRYEHSAVCMLSDSRNADGGWQTKEFVYPMKHLVNGDSYAKIYTNDDLPTCYLLTYRTAHEALFRWRVNWQKL